MKSHVIMFQDRFASKVEDGSKPHTIRKPRKRPIAAGDRLSLRKWLGKPYRSKQKILKETVCVALSNIKIYASGAMASTGSANFEFDELAKRDGFANAREMIQWFDDTHGLPFEGVLIEWKV